jgi:hypothetical protein
VTAAVAREPKALSVDDAVPKLNKPTLLVFAAAVGEKVAAVPPTVPSVTLNVVLFAYHPGRVELSVQVEFRVLLVVPGRELKS